MEHPRKLLGKRMRRSTRLDQNTMENVEAPAKRTRARRNERNDTEASTTAAEPRNGLLTPEPSALTETESQIPPPTDPSTTFPFMKLPAELRLNVYTMALVRPVPLEMHIARAPDSTPSQPTNDIATTTTSSRITLQPLIRQTGTTPTTTHTTPTPPSTTQTDPITPTLLRLNTQIKKEALQLLYADNTFILTLATGIHTLATLHQRSRSLIKHVILTIPSHHDILDGFADLVRLGLRYCWGLKTFKIILKASLPDDGRVNGATSVYANAFHILRWLPRGCKVELEGCVSETVKKVVAEEGRLMDVLDEVSLTFL